MTVMHQKLKKAYFYSLTLFLLLGLVYINVSIRNSYKDLKNQITEFYNSDFHNDLITSIKELPYPNHHTNYKAFSTDRLSNYFPLLVVENGNIDSIKTGDKISKDTKSKVFIIKNEKSTFHFSLQNINARLNRDIVTFSILYSLFIIIIAFILYFIPSKYLVTNKF
jgi:hypothetical protein